MFVSTSRLRLKPVGLLQPLLVPIQPWEQISMDFITGLSTTTAGHDVVLVFVDKLTRTVLVTNQPRKYARQRKPGICCFKMPKSIISWASRDRLRSLIIIIIISDRDPRSCPSSGRHSTRPWARNSTYPWPSSLRLNGATECMNQVVEETLRAHCCAKQAS